MITYRENTCTVSERVVTHYSHSDSDEDMSHSWSTRSSNFTLSAKLLNLEKVDVAFYFRASKTDNKLEASSV